MNQLAHEFYANIIEILMLFFGVILVSILLDQKLSFQRDYSALWVTEWKRRSFREQGVTLKTSAPGTHLEVVTEYELVWSFGLGIRVS